MAEDDQPVGKPDGTRALYKLALLEGQDFTTDESGGARPRGEPEDEHEEDDIRLEHTHQHEHQEKGRERDNHIDGPHEDIVEQSSEVAGHGAVDGPDRDRDQDGQ